nr:MAG: hypothetical protein DIU61_09760 [Bacteroidota bacterium]
MAQFFLFLQQKRKGMNALIIILGIIIAYVAFMALAVGLARVMFPKIDIDEAELLDLGVLKMKSKAKKLKGKVAGQFRKLPSGKIPTGYTPAQHHSF